MKPLAIYADYISAAHDLAGHDWMWYRPLCQLGCQIVVFDHLQRSEREIIDVVEETAARFVFFMPVGEEFGHDTLAVLRDNPKVITVGWGSDDTRRWRDYSHEIAPLYNLYVTTDRDAYRAALDSGLSNVIHRQWGADHESFRPLGIDRTGGLVFIGRIAGDMVSDGRQAMIEAMKSAGLSFEWLNPCGGMSAGDQCEAINRARIAVAPQRGVDGQVQIKARIFENAACGTMVLAEWHPDAPNYYEPDREMVFWRDLDELIAKARYYIGHDAEREAIAAAGYRRTVRDHRMDLRLVGVLEAAGLEFSRP